MSGKQEAAYHGADIVTRLRLYGPESDYNGIMVEAADEIERLRGERDGAMKLAYGQLSAECFEIAEDIADGEPVDLANQNRQFAGERAYRSMAERFKKLASDV